MICIEWVKCLIVYLVKYLLKDDYGKFLKGCWMMVCGGFNECSRNECCWYLMLIWVKEIVIIDDKLC